ncbi:pH-response transcription factor pacC RIM101 [Fusarium pseudocircinatum]|uniref:pH-response transcription factor pacC RIM101 n=1 Tax=Fusarium pseudocircinatum TaxID=56676 RepID=A0A8H5P7Z9_9HYPO|nr:pH-response transcription factor pacC RIM101 [Fusarium pseudocircinatum]
MPFFALDQPQQLAAPLASSIDHKDSQSTTLVPSTTCNTSQISVTPSTTSNNLTCRWNACNQKFITPELLYVSTISHAAWPLVAPTERSILSTGAHITIKRHHIVSHILTHIDLKPHECRFCGKTFKRPQDLKKHVKRHAEDSIRPQPPSNMSQLDSPSHPWPSTSRSLQAGSQVGYTGYSGSNSRIETSAPAFPHHTGHINGYYASQPSTRHGLYFTQRSSNHSRSENTIHGAVPGSSSRKCNFEAVVGFFDSTKRRDINPSSYAHIDYSLMFPPSPLSVHNNLMVGNGQNIPLLAPMVHGGPATSRNPSAH